MKNDSVTVRADAVEWLKTHYPTLCEKSGLCERVGGRLYTRTFLATPKEAGQQSEPVALDRGDAVNLARTMLEVRDCKGITSYGVRVLSEAVMAMDAHISATPKEAGSQPTATKGEGDFEAAWAASGFTKFKETGHAMWEAALANRPTADVWPIARLVVVETESGNSTRIEQATFYAPGLPAGTHGVYPVAGCCQPTAARAVPTAITLSEEEAAFLGDFIGGSEGNPTNEITLSIGEGADGYGLYVWLTEYPEEGSCKVCALAAPADGKGAAS